MATRKEKYSGSDSSKFDNSFNSIYRYAQYWYLFLISLLVCFAVAYAYAHYVTPVYYISGTLLINTNDSESGVSENAAFSDLNTFKSGRNFDNEIEVLKSYQLMQRVLQDIPLNTSYFSGEPYASKELYGKDLPLKVIFNNLDSTAHGYHFVLHLEDSLNYQLEEEERTTRYKYNEVVERPYGSFTVVRVDNMAYPTITQETNKITVFFEDTDVLANYYSSWLQVEPINTNASVLNISITDEFPERGMDIINKLMLVYREDAFESKNQIATSTIKLIDERMQNLSLELKGIEKEVEQYKRQNKITDVASQSIGFVEESNRYQKQLAEWSIQIDVLETIEKYLSSSKGSSYNLVPSSLNIQDPTLQGLISKYNELQLERERLLKTTESINPLVQSIDSQSQNIRVNILENIRHIKDGLLVTRKSIKSRSELYDAKINNVPLVERELQEIDRKSGIKKELYKYLLEKREESALALASNSSNSQILRPAIVDDVPVEPKKQTIYLLAFLAGIGIPFAFVYIKERYNIQVQQKGDIEKITSTPVLGEISYNDTKDVIVVSETSRTSIAELFRLIRTNLQFVIQGGERKVILITSSVSGEGKTFFSLNLGASLGLTGKKVVVLDFDLRKPCILPDLDLNCEYGITEYLQEDKLSIEQIINKSDTVANLYLIGSGSIPISPAELMMNNRVEQLFDELKQKFDFILVDTAPVGQVSDAFNLSRFIDLTLYLVRYNYTNKQEIEVIDDIFINHKFKQPMIVLNGAKKLNSYKYGYFYGQKKKGSYFS